MTHNNRSKTATLVAGLFANFGAQTARWTESHAAQVTQTYIGNLCDLDSDDLARAIQRLMLTSKFLPTVAEIREECARAKVPHVDVGAAWAEVLRKVGSVGRYRTPTFSSPLIAKAVAAVGWQAICDSETIGVERAHFRKALEELAAKTMRNEQLGALSTDDRRQLAGLHEASREQPEPQMDRGRPRRLAEIISQHRDKEAP